MLTTITKGVTCVQGGHLNANMFKSKHVTSTECCCKVILCVQWGHLNVTMSESKHVTSHQWVCVTRILWQGQHFPTRNWVQLQLQSIFKCHVHVACCPLTAISQSDHHAFPQMCRWQDTYFVQHDDPGEAMFTFGLLAMASLHRHSKQDWSLRLYLVVTFRIIHLGKARWWEAIITSCDWRHWVM